MRSTTHRRARKPGDFLLLLLPASTNMGKIVIRLDVLTDGWVRLPSHPNIGAKEMASMVVKMVVKQLNEEDSISDNAYEISGGPAENRTRMTGLEDRCFVH